MGVVGAVFGGLMSLRGASQQRRAGARAQQAAEENARLIESETAENITQLRKTQRQTLGMSKAIVASSGIDFDARKIDRLRFSEGGVNAGTGGLAKGTSSFERLLNSSSIARVRGADEQDFGELNYGEQIAGDTEGSSAFQYLREMRRNFASDIGFMGKSGRSRARVTRIGGQVAMAQAKAQATQSYVSAINSFSSIGSGGGGGSGGNRSPSFGSGRVTSKPSVFNQNRTSGYGF